MTEADALPTVHDSVVHMLQDAAERRPDAIALKSGSIQLTYRDYAHSVATLAHQMVDLGARGERVALLMGNSIDMAIAMFAIHAAGAQAVPINPLYTAREVQYILSDAVPVATIHDLGVSDLISPLQDSGTRIAAGGTDFIKTGRNPVSAALPCAGRSGDAAIYRRHDRLSEGREHHAPPNVGEYLPAGGDPAHRTGQRKHRLRHAAFSRLCRIYVPASRLLLPGTTGNHAALSPGRTL